MVNMKESSRGSRLKADQIEEEDVMKIVSDAKVVEFTDKETGQKGTMKVFEVFFKGETREFVFNKTSVERIIPKYGEDSSGWVGKWVYCIDKPFYKSFNRSGVIFKPLGADKNIELDNKYWLKEDKPETETVGEEQPKTVISPEDISWT